MAEVTQAQYNTAKQTHRKISVRINLMDFNKQTIGSIEGQVISGTLTSDANSNIRNTCDIQMVVTDASFNVGIEGKIWLDRFLQIYVGVEDVHTGEMVWTNKGIYLLNQPTYQYDAETNTLSFQGVDMMALMTDMRGGQLTEAYLIPQGSNVRDAIIAILSVNGLNEYVVLECANSDGAIQPVPYDINFDAGATWWDVLESLQSILPNYQMYFDVDGVFHYEPIPYKPNEIVRMDDDIWKPNVISESVSYDFESVKNSIKVLGRTHSVSYFAVSAPNANVITLDIPQLTKLADGTMVGFSCKGNYVGAPYLQIIVNGKSRPAIYDNGEYVKEISAGDYWVISYSAADDAWKFLGHVQAVGEWKDDNPVSPFFIGNPAGEIKIVLYGGDYDNIMSDDLALQRAEWEIYQRCRLNDSINLTSVPIYWSEVNWMVSYTPLDSTQVAQYLIRSIQTDLTPEGTQTYNLVRWYPYYITYIPATAELLVRVYTNKTASGDVASSMCTNVDYIVKFAPNASAASNESRSATFVGDLSINTYADIWAKIPRFATGNIEPIHEIDAIAKSDNSAPASYIANGLKIFDDAHSKDGVVGGIDTSISEMSNKEATSATSMSVTVDFAPCDTGLSVPVERDINIVGADLSPITFSGTQKADNSIPVKIEENVNIVTEPDVVESPTIPAITDNDGVVDLTNKLTPNMDASAVSQVSYNVSISKITGTSDVVYEATSIQQATIYEVEATVEGGTPPTSRVQQYIQGVIEEITAEDTEELYTSNVCLLCGFANGQRELKKITFNDSITSVGNGSSISSFVDTRAYIHQIYDCKKLELVVFPSALEDVYMAVGEKCGEFVADFSKCVKVPKVCSSEQYSGEMLPNSSVIRVPNSLLDEWKTADKWSDVAYKIVGV